MRFDIDQWAARHPLQRLASGGRTLSYRECGEAEPIVMLHGIGSSSGSWLNQLGTLSGRYRVIAWDAPGYGASTPLDDAEPAAADYADALDLLLRGLRVDRAVLVGHSFGALVAGAFAARHPERVRGLLLLDPASGHGALDAATRVAKRDSRLKMMAELGPQRLADERSANLLSSHAPARALALVRWNMSQLDPDGYAQATHMLAGARLADDLARYPGPLTVMCGSEDRITPEDGCRKLAAANARAEYRSLPGLGHACYVEAPQVVDQAIIEFVEDCGRREAAA